MRLISVHVHREYRVKLTIRNFTTVVCYTLYTQSQITMTCIALTVLKIIQFLYQRTPLHIAVEEGRECTVESLVGDFKAGINNKDNDGVSKSPVFMQCIQFHYINQSVTQTNLEMS